VRDERRLSSTTGRGLVWLLVLGVLAPVFITLIWGDVYADTAYQQFEQARAIARGTNQVLDGLKLSLLWDSPLYTRFLAWMTRFPWPLPTSALTLSVLGWMAAIVTWFWTGLTLGRPMFSGAATVLLALHPLQPQVLGLEAGPVLGLVGLATLLAMRRKSIGTLIAVVFLIAAQPAAFAFAVPLFFCIWIWRRSRPNLSHVAVSMIAGATSYALLCLLGDGCAEPRRMAMLWTALQLSAAAAFAFLVPGLDWLVRPTDDRRALQRGMVSMGLIALVLWQGNTLVEKWRMRPTDRLTLYKRMALWLRDHTLPTEIVGASQAGLLGYLADRATLVLPTPATTEAPVMLAAIDQTRPDYVITLNSLVWHATQSQPWFQERYQQIYQLASPYDSGTPLTVFRYSPSPFDVGETITTTARFTPDTEEWIELISYRLDRRRITPGEPLHLTLNWRAATAIHQSLLSAVRLVDPTTGRVWAQAQSCAPGGLATEFWNAEERVVDRHALVPPVDLPPGDYVLDVAFSPCNDDSLPVLIGCQGDALRREPLILAQAYCPPEVSTTSLTPDHPLRLTFGDAIELVGYDVPERVAPGESLRVALYWHALQPIPRDYKVFVHLLASNDQLLAQHDSPPIDWSYPTTRWQPGEYIRDEHSLTLDPSTSRGDYLLSIGLYDAATGERAVVRDAAGNRIGEQRTILQQIQVR
jgi:hypothetical protein